RVVRPQRRDQEGRNQRENHKREADEPEPNLVARRESRDQHAAEITASEQPARRWPPARTRDYAIDEARRRRESVFVQCGNERRHQCLRNSSSASCGIFRQRSSQNVSPRNCGTGLAERRAKPAAPFWSAPQAAPWRQRSSQNVSPRNCGTGSSGATGEARRSFLVGAASGALAAAKLSERLAA